MKKLRKRARALSRRIARTQKWRQRAAKLVKWLRDHNQHRLAKAATRVTTGLGKRLKALHADLRKVQERIDKLGEQAAAADSWAVGESNTPTSIAAAKRTRHTGVASGAAIAEKGRTSGSNSATFLNRRILIWPVRVG